MMRLFAMAYSGNKIRGNEKVKCNMMLIRQDRLLELDWPTGTDFLDPKRRKDRRVDIPEE
jgi:hypothetical protein